MGKIGDSEQARPRPLGKEIDYLIMSLHAEAVGSEATQ